MKQGFPIAAVLFTALCIAPARAQDAAKSLTVRSIAEAPAFSKRALVIGVQDYRFARKLSVPDNDAHEFARLLHTQLGFPDDAITLMTDAPDTPEPARPTYTQLLHTIRVFLAGIAQS